MNITDGVLYKTKVLTIGAMESCREGGSNIREYISSKLEPMGLTCWNHYQNPIIGINEGNGDLFGDLLKWREKGMYEEVAKHKNIRHADLALVDKADIIIMHYNKELLSCGTWEEVFRANTSQSKPIFVFSDQGVKALPIWMFWTLDYKYFYDSVDDVIDELTDINDGTKPIDNHRWKLLRKEYR